MDELKKNVFVELALTVWSAVPLFGGATLLLLAFAVGSYKVAMFGFLGIAVAIGVAATNLVFNWNSVSDKAIERWQKELKKKKRQELDHLDSRLSDTKGKNDEHALRNLRALYDSFTDALEKGQIGKNVPPYMIELIDEIFESCILRLDQSLQMYESGQTFTGDLKTRISQQRLEVVAKVEESVEQLAHTIQEVRALRLKSDVGQLTSLQTKLQQQLHTAKAIHEEVEGIGEEKDYGEYDTE